MQSDRDGSSTEVTWEGLAVTYRQVAQGLCRLGLGPGDRIGILSENRPEWVYADLAIYAAKGIVVPIHCTLTPAHICNILDDCAAKAVFVSNARLLEGLLGIRGKLPYLKTVIIFDPPSNDLPQDILPLQALIDLGGEVSRGARDNVEGCEAVGQGSDVATIIYTSGTMGESKGVVLTHDNLLSNLKGIKKSIAITDSDSCVSLLPLSHIFERSALYLLLYSGARIHYARSPDVVVNKISEVRPTILFSVPRFYEKVFARLQEQMTEGPTVPGSWRSHRFPDC